MDSTITSDIPRRRAIWFLILILILAAGLRLWVISRTSLPAGDGAGSNMELAVNLLEGRGWESDRKWTYFGPWGDWGPIPHPEGNQQPLTSVLVAGAILINGVDYRSGQAVALILSLASLVLIYIWASKRFNRTVALMAAGLGALSSSQVWFGANLDTQITFQVSALIFFITTTSWLPDSPQSRINLKHMFVLGVLAGITYLARANGSLLLVGLWLWLLFWGGRGEKSVDRKIKQLIKHILHITPAILMSLLGFCLAAAPWLFRNWHEFGAPFYTQNTYFIYTEDFYSAWSVRTGPPSAAEWFSHHSIWDFIVREGRGIYAAIEPFFLGNLHRNEKYVEGPLIVFTLMGFIWLLRNGKKHKDALPLMVLGMHFIALAAHSHVFRYLLPFYMLTFAYGSAGLRETWLGLNKRLQGYKKKWAAGWLGILMLLIVLSPMARPLALVLKYDDRLRGEDLYEAADYIAANTQPGQAVADFPMLETLIWKYRRPTISMPYDRPKAIAAVLAKYQPAYIFVTPELVEQRKGLSEWLALDDEGRVIERRLSPNWQRVWTNRNGKMVIYKLEW